MPQMGPAFQGVFRVSIDKDMLRMGGVELIEVDPAPYKNPNNYTRFAGRLAEERAQTDDTQTDDTQTDDTQTDDTQTDDTQTDDTQTDDKGVIWANQFDNTANMIGHYYNLSPETWQDTQGQ